jgi:TRAP-type C4-dicarboxylate transport system substrate-binding protein
MNWGYAPAMSADGAAGSPGGRFEKTLLAKSDGRFKLNIRETMVPREQELDFIARNNAQLGDMSITYVAGTYPVLDFGALPFRFTDIIEYESCMNDPDMIAIFDKVFRDAGLEYLSSLPSGNMKYIWAKKPLTGVGAFANLKLRTTGAVATKAFQLLGAAPVSIPGPEMGDAMYRGVVDACVTTLDYGMEQGLDDFSTDISVWSVMPVISGAWTANAEAYDKLPADLRWALDETAKEVSAQQYYAAGPEFVAFLTWVSSTTLQLHYPPQAEVNKARDLTADTVNDWLKTAGPYGQQVLDISARYIP